VSGLRGKGGGAAGPCIATALSRRTFRKIERDTKQNQCADQHPIGTLCPETAEEAKTLIPSIQNKISDDDLDQLLKEINDLRNFVE